MVDNFNNIVIAKSSGSCSLTVKEIYNTIAIQNITTSTIVFCIYKRGSRREFIWSSERDAEILKKDLQHNEQLNFFSFLGKSVHLQKLFLLMFYTPLIWTISWLQCQRAITSLFRNFVFNEVHPLKINAPTPGLSSYHWHRWKWLLMPVVFIGPKSARCVPNCYSKMP